LISYTFIISFSRISFRGAFFTCAAFHPYEACIAAGKSSGEIVLWWRLYLPLILDIIIQLGCFVRRYRYENAQTVFAPILFFNYEQLISQCSRYSLCEMAKSQSISFFIHYGVQLIKIIIDSVIIIIIIIDSVNNFECYCTCISGVDLGEGCRRCTPPLPKMTCSFIKKVVFCKKRKEKHEMSQKSFLCCVPFPNKNPGSSPLYNYIYCTL